MSLFNWYKPRSQLCCPIDGTPLLEWQGKDGINALFVWQEGIPYPVDQDIDDPDVRSADEERLTIRLPKRFLIYSYDCPMHQPIEAICETVDETWQSTTLRKTTR